MENTMLQSSKRPLQCEQDEQDLVSKKMRLSVPAQNEDVMKTAPTDVQMKTLITFEKFMRTKLFNKKLTKSDLEQFCLQKICEAIMHKTELGEVYQLVKKQDQLIESLRKDVQQLSKQNRDLEIVHKKLINEMKGPNSKQKPLVPLKITRSVGLQVKLAMNADPLKKRAPATPNRSSPITNTVSSSTTPVNSRQRNVQTNGTVVRQVTNSASPRKPVTPSATILSQALQPSNNRQSTTPTNKTRALIRPKTVETTKPSNPGVIDLTDEDDRAAKPLAGQPIKLDAKQIATATKIAPAKSILKPPNTQNRLIAANQHIKTNTVINKSKLRRFGYDLNNIRSEM